MCGSGVLHCELTLLLWCETALVGIDSFRLMLANKIIEENRVYTPLPPTFNTYFQRLCSCRRLLHCLHLWFRVLPMASSQVYPRIHSCVVWCRMGSLPEMTWAVDKQPDDIWTDLEQHITFYFPDTPWPMSHQGPPLSLSLLWSWQVSLCWQWPLKCSLLDSHAVQYHGLLASPPRMFFFCSK